MKASIRHIWVTSACALFCAHALAGNLTVELQSDDPPNLAGTAYFAAGCEGIDGPLRYVKQGQSQQFDCGVGDFTVAFGPVIQDGLKTDKKGPIWDRSRLQIQTFRIGADEWRRLIINCNHKTGCVTNTDDD